VLEIDPLKISLGLLPTVGSDTSDKMKGEQMGIAEQHPKADINPEVCPDWTAISRIFDSFEAPRLEIASEGDVSRVAWIFRGLKSNEYELEPSIERFAKDKWIDWAALELLILEEFRSRAAMHIDVRDLTDDLSWRALMRHHGVPTRLLDFTHSPYVALYFALRERTEREQGRPVLIWAIDAEAIVEKATAISREADRVDEEETAGRPPKRHAVSLHPGDASTDRDELQRQLEGRRRLANKALSATGPDGTTTRSVALSRWPHRRSRTRDRQANRVSSCLMERRD
jgi:hypothetical protein